MTDVCARLSSDGRVRPSGSRKIGAAIAVQDEIEAGELVARPVEHPRFASVQARVLVRYGRARFKASDKVLKPILSKLTVFQGRSPASQ
jgi:hypothetical protein